MNNSVLIEDDTVSVLQLHPPNILKLQNTLTPCLDLGLLKHCRGGAADMEGAHCQLRAGFADGLGGNDAHRLSHFSHDTAGKVYAIAFLANTTLGFTGQHRAEFDPFDACIVNCAGVCLVNNLTGLAKVFVRVHRIDDVLSGYPANQAILELDDLVLALIDSQAPDTVSGSAVQLPDDNVLGHIHQFPGQVSGVGGLERGVGQALSRTMRRDEVVQHRQPLAEIGQDWFFNNIPRRLGHKTTQAGQLANLLTVATGT